MQANAMIWLAIAGSILLIPIGKYKSTIVMKALAFLLVMSVVLAAGCVSQEIIQVNISAASGQKIVSVEVADSPEAWQTGLMNRVSLPENSGMLFVFPGEQPRSFWMKNTLIPLDMLFISANLSIIDIATMQPCKADPCPSYRSKAPAMYVLEVNAGYAEKNNILVGNKIAFLKS